MAVAATTTEAALEASMASLKLSIEWMKDIQERSKSTDATLARIAHMRASWKPQKHEVQLTTIATQLSATPTVASLNLSLQRGKQMEELSRSINVSLAGITRLQEGIERRRDSLGRQTEVIPSVMLNKSSKPCLMPQIGDVGIPIPVVVVESTDAVATSTLALLLTARMVATCDSEMVLHIGAPKVFEEIPSKTSVTATMLHAFGPGIDQRLLHSAEERHDIDDRKILNAKSATGPDSVHNKIQISHMHCPISKKDVGTALLPEDPFRRADQECYEMLDASVNKELVAAYKLVCEEPLKHVMWDDEIRDDVVTHVGGMSLFGEFSLDFAEDVCVERFSKEMASDKDLVDIVLTHVSDQSLFIEHGMATCHEFQGGCCVDSSVDYGVGLTKLSRYTGFTRDFRNIISISICGTPSILSQIIREATTEGFSCQSLLELHISWDPGGSPVASLASNSAFFAGHAIVYTKNNQSIDSMGWEDNKALILEVELYVQWDPGIMTCMNFHT